MSNITEICKMTLVIQDESKLGLETSATIAERLYKEGCRIGPVVALDVLPKGEWKEISYHCSTAYCTNCHRTVRVFICDGEVQYALFPYCGSKNSQ